MMSDLTQEEKQLAILMSQISESCYSAGWMQDIEYVLWDALLSGPRDFGHGCITQEHIDLMIQISNATNTWIIFDNEQEETSIQLDIWKQLFKEKAGQMPEILHR